MLKILNSLFFTVTTVYIFVYNLAMSKLNNRSSKFMGVRVGHLTEVLTLIMDKSYLAKIKDFINLFPVHGEMYSTQHYVIKFVSDLRQVGGFLHQ
jgi:hypothetical protein